MSDHLNEAESDLIKLGRRLRRGWAKEHSVSEQEQDAVLKVVREQWEKEQQHLQSGAQSKQQAPEITEDDPTRRKSPEQDDHSL